MALSDSIDSTLSVYVHIPFCSRRCDYCDFATWTDREDNVNEYIETVIRQWRYNINAYGHTAPELTSIFFGGGTPNLIDADHIARIIETIARDTRRTSETEITVESNPDHVRLEQMQTYVSAGVNRISLGIQSTNNEVLKFLGREHAPEHVRIARDIIRDAGIKNVNGDLIYGSANESLDDWCATLNDVLSLELNHISAYALGIEPGTALGRSVVAQEKFGTNDDDLADKYELAEKILSDSGFNWYEISNWSQPGYESRHNLAYWRGRDVIALGCAAHGFTHSKRWSTPRHIDSYLERFSGLRNPEPITDELFLDRNDLLAIGRDEELFSLKLRTREGITWPVSQPSGALEEFIHEKFVDFEPHNSRVSLSVKGRLMAHRVTIDLFEEYAQMGSVVE